MGRGRGSSPDPLITSPAAQGAPGPSQGGTGRSSPSAESAQGRGQGSRKLGSGPRSGHENTLHGLAWLLTARLPSEVTQPSPSPVLWPSPWSPQSLTCPQGNQVREHSRSNLGSPADTNLDRRTRPTCPPRKLNPLKAGAPG